MWRSRIFWRQFGAQAILLLAAIGLLGLLIVRRVESRYLQETEEGLRARAYVVAELVRSFTPEQMPQLQERLAVLHKETGLRITLIAADGKVLIETDRDPASLESHADRPEVQAAHEGHFATITRFSTTTGQEMMYGTLYMGDTKPVAFVRVAVPLTNVLAEITQLRRIVWTTAALTAVAVLALALWLARRVALPLQELTHAAEHIAAGNYGSNVRALGRDEIGQLAHTFNHMSERLAVQFTQLQEDRQQLRTILGAMIEGVIALDARQCVLFANDCAANLLGFHSLTVVGRRLRDVVRHRALQELADRAVNSSEPCRAELTLPGPTKRSLTIHAVRLPGPATHPEHARGVVLVLHDTTDLRRLERLRQEFVANVSHELKTPLSIIKVCIETLIDSAAEDPQHRHQFLKRVEEQADRLHALILDLLSLARIESGEEVFDIKPVRLAPLVTACLERHLSRAAAHNQILEDVANRSENGESNGTSHHDLAVWADEEAVSQILDNLVDNALKYTPEGGRISVRCREDGEQVVLEVIDTGIGIPEQDLPRIFERFYRVDKARSRELGGTGLGLSIVKHLVQSMQGTVSANSGQEPGSTFQVRLPRASVNETVRTA